MTDRKAENAGYAILNTRTVHAGWARYLLAAVRMPDGRTVEREIEDHGQSVCVLPYNPERKTAVLVRQTRAAVLFACNEQETLEAIAGIIENEEPLACARREAKEEAQLELASLEPIFTLWTMPGISTERMHMFLATYTGGVRADVRGGVAEEDEDIIAVEIGLAELVRMADSGELADAKTLLALQTLRLRQPHLFMP